MRVEEHGSGDRAASEGTSGVGITRRTFITGSAAGAFLALTARFDPATRFALSRGARLAVADAIEPAAEGAQPQLHLSVDRDTDLFQADFTFYGFTLDKTSSPPALVATATPDVDIWVGVVVQLPPQAFAEGDYAYPTFPSGDSDLPFDPTPVLSELSGTSRLAFTFAKGDRINLPTMSAADLLVWDGWALNVPSTAIAGSGASQPSEPSLLETAIEAPFGLLLAPVVPKPVTRGRPAFSAEFAARTVPFTYQGVTESWSASLAGTDLLITDAGYTYEPPVAAVWALDYGSEASITFPPTCYILYEEYQAPPQGPQLREGQSA